nr:hypothetical protein [Tanacetum cinerariifolium]
FPEAEFEEDPQEEPKEEFEEDPEKDPEAEAEDDVPPPATPSVGSHITPPPLSESSLDTKDVAMNTVQKSRVQNVGNQNGLIGVQGNENQNQIGNDNLVVVRAEGNAAGHNENQIRGYNYRRVGHFARDCTIRPRRRDAAYLQIQLLIAQKEDVGIQLQAEKFTSNEGESIESYYHRFLKLMNDLKRNKHFPKKIASNLKFLNNLQPEWSRHVTIVHQTKDLHTADYTQLYDFLKYSQKEVDELKAERLVKTQDPLALMANSNNPYTFSATHQDQSLFNQNYLQQPMPNPEDITDPTTAMNMALSLMDKAFKLNYSTPTNKNQRISSNPRNRQIAQPGMNMGQDRQMQMIGGNGGNQFRQYAGQNAGNLNGYNAVQNVRNQNQIGNGNLVAVRAEENAAGHNGNQIRCYNFKGIGHFARDCTVRPRRRDAAYLQTQLLIAQKEEAGIQLQAEEYDLMAAAADLDEIEEVNANCILMANL